MTSSYLAILRAPGALRVFLPAAVGRLSFAMVTLSCVILLADTTGSYAIAGTATGLLGLANVLVAPARARIVGRVGQRHGLRLLAAGFALASTGLVVAASVGVATPWLLGLAAAAGASAPPVGAAMRMRWRLLVEPAHVSRAYSLDAVSEEIVFTVGPPVAGLLIAATVPQAGLVASGVCAVVGCFAMTTSASDPPPGQGRATRDVRRANLLRTAGFLPVLALMSAIGMVLGAVVVIVPAQTAPDELLAGLLLGALAAGSAAGGLVYGSREWRWTPAARLISLASAMTVGCALLAAASPTALLALCLAATGIALAPAMVSGYLVVDRLTDDRDRLEAHTWVNTALNAGAAAASAGAGIVVDHVPASAAYLIAATAAAVLVAAGAAGLRTRRRRLPPEGDSAPR